MDVKQLKYFVTIANEGSISAAARKLYMSQPPLSQQMKLLEEELGCTLFSRGNKSVSLTAQGKALYQRANDILSLMKSTKDEVMKTDMESNIRIGVVSSLIDFICERIEAFENEGLNTRFEITEGNTYQLLDALDKGMISIAIVRKPYPSNQFEQCKIMDDEIVAVGIQQKEKIFLSDLTNQSLIVYRRWSEYIEKQFADKSLECHFHYLNDDARTSLSLAKKGLGIAIVPKSCTIDCGMAVSEIQDCKINSEIMMLYKREAVTLAEQAFVKSIMNRMK